MGWNIHGTIVPVATMSMESKEQCGNFSHIQKDIIRTKRDAIVLRPRFSFRKDTEATQIWPPEQNVLVQELKIYLS